jgi:hypothetical protein
MISGRRRERFVVGIIMLCLTVWAGLRGPLGPHGNGFGVYALAGTLLGGLVAMAVGWWRPGLRARVVSLLAVIGGLAGLLGAAVISGGPILAVLLAGLVFGLGALVIALGAVAGGLLWLAVGARTEQTNA